MSRAGGVARSSTVASIREDELIPTTGNRAACQGLTLALLAACSPPAGRQGEIAVVEATIAEIQQAIRSGATSCRAVVEAHLDRIEAYDRPSGLNAVTVVNPRALARADEIDAALARGSQPGPLFCVPVLVKDNFDTHDLPTTGGSIALARSRPPDDAFLVRRLREADAILLAAAALPRAQPDREVGGSRSPNRWTGAV